jgi:hypothetical protein
MLSKAIPFEQAIEYVGYVVDDALNGRRVEDDQHAVVTDNSVLVGWQCGFEPMFVAVNSACGGKLGTGDAEQIATDYLLEIGWLTEERYPEHILVKE